MNSMKIHKNQTIILKPESGAEGNGITLVKDYKSIPTIAFQKPYIAQHYLEDPYVLDNKKFDLRIYVMVTSLGSGTGGDDPITAFIADEGMARFCTEDYLKPDADNIDVLLGHLTNYSLNKNSDNYMHSEDLLYQQEGSKRTLSSVFKLLQQDGVDTEALFERIKEVCMKTLIAL